VSERSGDQPALLQHGADHRLALDLADETVRCASRRFVSIHVATRYKHRRVRSVTATIDGLPARVGRTRDSWVVRVDMRGHVRATVRIKLRLRLDHGRPATVARAYRTCDFGTSGT